FADVAVRPLLERKTDIEPDAFSVRLVRAAVCGFHDAGAASRADDEAMARRFQRQAPSRQLEGQFARVFVVARPLERLAATLQRRGELRCLAVVTFLQTIQRTCRPYAAVHARGPEEHHRVLDVLFPQP